MHIECITGIQNEGGVIFGTKKNIVQVCISRSSIWFICMVKADNQLSRKAHGSYPRAWYECLLYGSESLIVCPDTAMVLRFFSTFALFFSIYCVLSMIVLVPINATGSNRHRNTSDPLFVNGLSILSIANLNVSRAAERQRLWVHAIFICLFSLVLMWLFARDYGKVHAFFPSCSLLHSLFFFLLLLL